MVTRWGETTQLFVEFPALVKGGESRFAAHLTRLEDHLAIDAGTVVVELSGGGMPVERFSVTTEGASGIFRPVIQPAHAGQRAVTLRLDGPQASELHDMGNFTVFNSQSEAAAAAPAEEEANREISYLLEQQWKVRFRVLEAVARPMRPSIPAFARLVVPTEAESIIVAPRAGRLTGAGDRFPKVGETRVVGESLFVLSTAPQEAAEPASLDLEVTRAAIDVAAARREVERLTPLVTQGVVAVRRLEEAGSVLAGAEAGLRAARRLRGSLSQSQRVGAQGDGLTVPSPIGGTIAEVLAPPGAWVTAGQPLMRIVDRDRLWLDVWVPESSIPRLGRIGGAWFRLDSSGAVIEVPADALVLLGTEVDPRTRTLAVRFEVDNTGRALFAGMTPQAQLIVDDARPSTAVPFDAVVDDGGMDVVYVQIGGESFVRRLVRLGVRDGGLVEVIEGVKPGEWVVERGAYSVKLASTSTESIGHGHAH